MKIKMLFYGFLLKIGFIMPTHYINGAQTLPPPLNADEEAILLSRDDKKAKDILIVHNLRLVVYIARKFEAPNTNI
jgi:RNA polymerase sporulation-specific sigma factor